MRRALLLALIFFILVADQTTKSVARMTLAGAAPRHYGVLTLVYTDNRGAFLSLGENLPEGARTIVFDVVTVHRCAPVPLQSHNCTTVPFAAPAPETSRHLARARDRKSVV